jgi:hypothetical protein
MSAKLVFLVGVLGVGGYAGYKMSNYDPAVFAYSKEQVQTMLADAKTSLPRRDGDGQIQIWSTGRSEKGVKLNMQYASWAPLLECEAVITAVAPNQSRVVPDCGGGSPSGSAIGDTQKQLRIPMFAEHIQATLNKRAFNRDRVDQMESATVLKNLGGMQREALQRADEAQRLQAGR